MSQFPRRVLFDITVSWDKHANGSPAPIFVRRGTIVDIVPGSLLESCYGQANLSAVIDPRDPKRGDEMGAQTFSKAALAN